MSSPDVLSGIETDIAVLSDPENNPLKDVDPSMKKGNDEKTSSIATSDQRVVSNGRVSVYREYLNYDDDEEDDDEHEDDKTDVDSSVLKDLPAAQVNRSSQKIGIRMAERSKLSSEQENLNLRIKVREYEKLLRKKNITVDNAAGYFSASPIPEDTSFDLEEKLERERKEEALEKENTNLQEQINDLKRKVESRSRSTVFSNGSDGAPQYTQNTYPAYQPHPQQPYYQPTPVHYSHGVNGMTPSTIPYLHPPATYPMPGSPKYAGSTTSPHRTSPVKSPSRTRSILNNVKAFQAEDLEDQWTQRNKVIERIISGSGDINEYFGQSSDTLMNNLELILYNTALAILDWDISEEAERKCESVLEKFYANYDKGGISSDDKNGHITMLTNIVQLAAASRERSLERIEQQTRQSSNSYAQLRYDFDKLQSDYDTIFPAYCSLVDKLSAALEPMYLDYDESNLLDYALDALNVLRNLQDENANLRSSIESKEKENQLHSEELIHEMEALTEDMTSKSENLIKEKETRIQALENALSDVKKEHELTIKALRNEIERKHDDLMTATQQLQEVSAKIAGFGTKQKQLELENSEREGAVLDLKSENEKLAKKLDVIKQEHSESPPSSSPGPSDPAWRSEYYQQLFRLQERNQRLERENQEQNEKIKDLEKRVRANKQLSSGVINKLISGMEPVLGHQWAERTSTDLARLPEGTSERTAIKLKMIDTLLISEIENLHMGGQPMTDEARIWRARYDEMKTQYKREKEERQALKIGARDQIQTLQKELQDLTMEKAKPITKLQL